MMEQDWPSILEAFERDKSSALDMSSDLSKFIEMIAASDNPLKHMTPGSVGHFKDDLIMMEKVLIEVMAFCEKLEMTYAKDRKSPKNALAQVYSATHRQFGLNFPIKKADPRKVSTLSPSAILADGFL